MTATIQKKNSGVRVLLNVALAVSIVWFPWWVVLCIGLTLLLLADAYEVLLFGLIWDILYGAPTDAFFGIQYLMTSVFIVGAIAGLVVRRMFNVRFIS